KAAESTSCATWQLSPWDSCRRRGRAAVARGRAHLEKLHLEEISSGLEPAALGGARAPFGAGQAHAGGPDHDRDRSLCGGRGDAEPRPDRVPSFVGIEPVE